MTTIILGLFSEFLAHFSRSWKALFTLFCLPVCTQLGFVCVQGKKVLNAPKTHRDVPLLGAFLSCLTLEVHA